MDIDQFWDVIESARGQRADAADAEAVAARAETLLSALSSAEIVAAERLLQGLLADSYRSRLWAAAYVISGGCSDDGFDYFRGWLIMQGRGVFERAVADPDSLAGLPAIRDAVADGSGVECEDALYVASNAHEAAGAGELPDDVIAAGHSELDAGWDFDFEGQEEMRRRLPALAALCWSEG